MPPRRVQNGIVFVLTFALAATLTTYIVVTTRPRVWGVAAARKLTPYRWWQSPDFLYDPWDVDMPTEPPEPREWMSNAPWPGQWPMPDFKHSPLLVKLHIFSMSNPASKARRNRIRAQDWLRSLPQAYRQLVEIKFILGRCEMYCDDLADEQETYGDIMELDMQENMNWGKSTQWLRSVNRAGEQEALWVFKVDDDTLVYVQNLLDILVRLDPTIPTYIGDPMRDWEHRYMYMQGGMYGVSYGIVRTLEAADMPAEELTVDYPEDSRIGHLISILPHVPDKHAVPDPSPFPIPPERHRLAMAFGLGALPDHGPKQPQYPPPGRLRRQPSYAGGPLVSLPNQDSGLVRIVLKGFLGHKWDGELYRDHRQVAVHAVKTDEEYTTLWAEHQAKLEKAGKDKWKAPPELEKYLSL